jgi:hypothetical protein
MVRINLVEGLERTRQHYGAKFAFVLFVMCSLAMVWPTWSAANATVDPAPPAPTLVAPVNSSHTVKTKPLIIGLTKNDTWVKVYIDGTFNGQFKATNHASGTSNFAYTPFLHLKPGWHQVYVNSMDSTGRASLPSATLRFFVEYPYPAPTVFTPVVNEETTPQRPWIVGIARNDSLVKVFIDSRMNGQMIVKNSSNGTGSFAYRTFYPITPGRHTFFAMAVDSTGKESRASDVMEFTVATPVTISPVPAVTDPQGVVKGDETKNQQSTIKSNDNTNSNGSVNVNENTNDNANANTNSEVANTETDKDNSRWPLIVGLTVLAVIIIVLIDNMVRRSRGRSDDSNSKPFSSHEPKTPSQGNQPNQSNQTNSNRPAKDFFPPPPPKMK